jgi:N-acyl homoserine lactone hydrolase
MKLFAFTCGWLTGDLSLFVAGETGRVRVPVPSYLIEHPGGMVLFDSGMHPAVQNDPAGRLGLAASIFEVEFQPGEEIRGRLESIGVDPARIAFLVSSHLHFDHVGGNELIPNARLVVQRREWAAGHDADGIARNYFDPKDYDHGHDVLEVDGELDLFGDGRVVCFPTYGHTPGHQSLRLRLDSGDVVLTGDSCYFRRTLDEMRLPSVVAEEAAMRESLEQLRILQRGGARIFYGHDPEFWAAVPQAPAPIR